MLKIKFVFRPIHLIGIFLFCLIAYFAYGYAATNLVPNTALGVGSGDVLGYDIRNIRYTLNTNDPRKITKVQFMLVPDAGTQPASSVAVAFMRSGADDIFSRQNCTEMSNLVYECTLDPEFPTELGRIRIIAVQ